MNEMTVRELNKFERKRIDQPEGYAQWSDEERRAFVLSDILKGNHPAVEVMSTKSLLYFGTELQNGSPEYFLYRIFLALKDPAEVARELNNDTDHMIFIEVFGHEVANQHEVPLPWLSLYAWVGVYNDYKGRCKEQLRLLLESHGAEAIAAEVTTEKDYRGFVDIFGIKATRLLSRDIAKQFQGGYLEEALGL
jgi:hypothetical protein